MVHQWQEEITQGPGHKLSPSCPGERIQPHRDPGLPAGTTTIVEVQGWDRSAASPALAQPLTLATPSPPGIEVDQGAHKWQAPGHPLRRGPAVPGKWPEPQQPQEEKLQGDRPPGKGMGGPDLPHPQCHGEVTALLPPPPSLDATDTQSPGITVQWATNPRALAGGPGRAETLAV